MSPSRSSATALVAILLLGAAGCTKDASAPAAKPPATNVPAPESAAPGEDVTLCEHGVPADLCTQCDPDLAAVFQAQGDWCAEHAVPESHCFECNPQLRFAAKSAPPADWCAEHAVPESKCTLCHPKLVAQFIQAGDYCREHRLPFSVCPIHHPELVRAAGAVPPAEVALTTRVRLASADTAREAGLRTVTIQEQPFAPTLEVVGQLAFNQNRLAQLSARGDALIQEVRVDVGDEVAAGQPLVVLTSATVGEGQAQRSTAAARVSAAQAAVERERGLVAKGISPQQDLERAQAELAAAQGALGAARASLGAAGASGSGSDGRYVLTAPFAGTVVARNATAGRSASHGEVLIELADLSAMWAQLEVPEGEANLVRPGLPVSLRFEGLRGAPLEATITRVAPAIDPQTRTVRARVELPNPGARLKAGVFLKAGIRLAPEHAAVFVPREAVQTAEGRTLVFVKQGPGLYRPVSVELGAIAAGSVEVVKGLSPGAEVVTTGAFLLKTEILKDSIGAGCCEEGE